MRRLATVLRQVRSGLASRLLPREAALFRLAGRFGVALFIVSQLVEGSIPSQVIAGTPTTTTSTSSTTSSMPVTTTTTSTTSTAGPTTTTTSTMSTTSTAGPTTSTTSTTSSSIPTTTTTSTSTTTTRPDDYQCYELKPGADSRKNVSIEDQFGHENRSVHYPRRLCVPADVDGGGIRDAVQQLAGHKTARRLFLPRRAQTVVNQFGTVVVDVLRSEVFMVPSATSATGPATPLTPPTIDHFQCYKVKRSAGAASFQKRTVTLADQFGPVSLTVVRPSVLCAPANKNGEDPTAPSHPLHLLCYRTRSTTPFGEARLALANQFGPDEITLIHRRELCVPSLKNP